MDVEQTLQHIAELRRRIKVEEAFCEGKAIEYRRSGCSEWQRIDSASWNWEDGDYRIAPEPPKPTYRPFANAEEFRPHRERWVIDQTCNEYRINEIGDDGFSYGCNSFAHWQSAVDELWFADTNTPIGVEVTQ